MKRTRRKRGTVLLVLVMLMFAVSAWAEDGIVSGTTVSGTVRVSLSSIAQYTSVDLTIDGSYSIGGDANRALARGTKMTVRNSGGTLTLDYNGKTETVGSRVRLRRHQAGGENGVRIAQARYPSNLYPGDIECIAQNGNVQIIVHVFMEDYMLGVLPYEMDNSFPLETLKAQAVAARTYALKKMSAQAVNYDVVDTTSDQVYNGTPPGNARCRQAVEETSGIVGTVGGEYMAGYYTASNGGQTESVKNAWGSGSYAYLQVKDDPYDLRNPASVAKSVQFYRDGTTSLSALTELLASQAARVLGVGYVRLNAIYSVTPHTPKYESNSHVYLYVDVALGTDYGDVTVTLDYFEQVEKLCSLSINVLKNETLGVSETVGGFKLTARRFGHGVGMSQRGAQQMGTEGFDYAQILAFYYPGLVRTHYTMTRTLLPSLSGEAGDVQGPISDAQTAIISLENPLDVLNMRREPSVSSGILAQIEHGTQVTLLEHGAEWSRIQYGTQSGYVKSSYLSVQSGAADEQPSDTAGIGTAVVVLSDESQTLNLRASPTTAAAVLTHLRHGQVLTVLERYGTWTRVQYGMVSGYVVNDYIVFSENKPPKQEETVPSVPTEGKLTATVQLQSADSRLNVRSEKGLGANVIARLSHGETVVVTAWGAEWCSVEVRGVSGYCATAYLHFAAQDDAEESDPFASLRAIVLPSSGLNLRRTASRVGSILMVLPQGTTLSVLGTVQNNDMLPVALGSVRGYVASEYVYVTEMKLETEAPTETASPEPTASPAPTAVPQAETATVTARGGLKLRVQPDMGAATLTTMLYGTQVIVSGSERNGFYEVAYGEMRGYASAAYLSFVKMTPIPVPTATPAPTPVPEASRPLTGRTATVIAPSGLNLRGEASSGAAVLAILGYGVNVSVMGDAVGGFYPVRVGTLMGYVSADYIAFDAQIQEIMVTPSPTPKTESGAYRVVVASDNGLNLRAAPSKNGDVVYVLPYGMVLEVIAESENGFLRVRWDRYTGYVAGDYVTPFGVQ